MSRTRSFLIWIAILLAPGVALAAAAMSPLLAWRDPVYITGGFAGVAAMALLLLQPLLAGGSLPGLTVQHAKRAHRWIGGTLVAAVIVHVAGLWITSPPDVIDALLFVSPTPFSAWGVIAMWAVFAAALMAALRKRLPFRPRNWRLGHTALVAIVVVGSVVHAWLIEGTMETVSKAVLCLFVVLATAKIVVGKKAWTSRNRP
ncbi:MAG: ferric reductase-like transmembrane domain-containing protein [Rhizobiaceae bacterium]